MRSQGNDDDKDKNKFLEECECCIGSSEQAPDFEFITKIIINYFQENVDSRKVITRVLRVLNNLSADE